MKKKFDMETFMEEQRKAEIEEEKEDIMLNNIRKSGKKKKVSSDEFYEHNEIWCRYCMNYNDDDDSCKAGVSDEEWDEIDRSGEDCEKFDYIYELDEDK